MHVAAHAPDQAALLAFYRRFLESPNFSAWFERQRAAAWAWQEAEWARAAEVPAHTASPWIALPAWHPACLSCAMA